MKYFEPIASLPTLARISLVFALATGGAEPLEAATAEVPRWQETSRQGVNSPVDGANRKVQVDDFLPTIAHRDGSGRNGNVPERQEVVFIDVGVDDYPMLVDGADPAAEVVMLDAGRDGVQQIAEYLAGRDGIDAVHIVSHGSVGSVQLGTATLSEATLDRYGDELATVGAALAADGDLLLYGCHVGADDRGAAFIESVAALTGADVAASDDLTGADDLGGDWTLEYQAGAIETDVAIAASAQDAFDGVLAPAIGTTTFDGDVGVLVSNQPSPQSATVDNYTFTVLGAGNVSITNTIGNVNLVTLDTLTRYEIESDDGSEFQLDDFGFRVLTAGFVGETMTITGFRDDVAVAGATATFNGIAATSTSYNVDVSADPDFDNIDEFQLTFTGSPTGTLAIEDITISGAVLPDTTPPAVQSIALVGSPAQNATSVDFTVTFDENANNITTGDFTVTTVSGTATGNVASVSSPTGTSVTVTVNSVTGDGAIRLDLQANTDITDDSGNGNNTNGYVAAFTSGGSHTVDRVAPTVTDANIAISGASGTGGAFVAGDTVTATWNNTASGDNNADTIAGVTVDFSAFGGGAAVAATNNSDIWTATYTLTAGTLDATNLNVAVTATDDAGNSTTTADTTGATADTDLPATAGAIAPSVAQITDAQVGTNTFTLTVNFDEVMDTAVAPTVTFPTGGEDPTAVGNSVASLANASGNWTDNDTYVVTFDVADDDIVISDIDVRVAGAQDSAGNTMTAATQNDIFSVITAPAPVVQAITSTSGDGTFGVGDAVNVTVTFDEAVDFTANGGTLQVTLSNGETLTLASGDAANQTSFSATYSIQEGETDSADLDVTAVSLTGGATVAASDDGVPANLALPAGQNLGDLRDIVIDANTPTVAVPDLTAATDTGASNTDNLTNNATPTIVGTTEPGATVSVRVGGAQVGTTIADGAGNWSYTFGAGQLSEGPNAVDIVASDAVNSSADSADLTITLDTAAPFLSAVDLIAASDTGASSTDDVTNDTTPTIEYTAVLGAAIDIDWGDGNGFVVLPAGTGATQTATLGTPYATDGAKTVTVRATDTAGNTSTETLALTVDTTAPVLASVLRQSPPDEATNAVTVVFRVDFGEVVDGVGAADFSLAGTAAGAATIAGVTSAGPGVFDVSVGGLTGSNGSLSLSLAAGATLSDLAGNALTDTSISGTNESYTIDTTAPVFTSLTRQNPADETTAADVLVFRASFSEAMANVDGTDFSVTGTTATVTGVSALAGDMNFDLTVSGGDLGNLNGAVGIDLAPGQDMTDSAGNALPLSEPATDETYTLDNSAPELSSIVRQSPTDETTNADTLTFRVTFDVDVQNVDATDFVVTGTTATVTGVAVVTADTVFDLTVSGGDLADLDATVGLDLAAGQDITDSVGNALPTTEPTTDERYTLDNTAPTVAVEPLTTSDTTPPLSGTVDDNDASLELTVDGQTVTPTNNGDGTWTLADDTLLALALGSYDITIVATDAAGNEATELAVDALTITTDLDGDGIPDAIEDTAPNGGDGNNDGIRDAEQADVASLPTAAGRGFMTLQVSGGCSQLEQVEAVDATVLPSDPSGRGYPFGLVAFSLPCERAQVDIIYHDAGSIDFAQATYRKYGPMTPGDTATIGWYDFSGFVSVSGNRWVLSLADNQLGDDTGDDGLIVDVGGPSTAVDGAVGIPVNQVWALWALILGMLIIAARFAHPIRR